MIHQRSTFAHDREVEYYAPTDLLDFTDEVDVSPSGVAGDRAGRFQSNTLIGKSRLHGCHTSEVSPMCSTGYNSGAREPLHDHEEQLYAEPQLVAGAAQFAQMPFTYVSENGEAEQRTSVGQTIVTRPRPFDSVPTSTERNRETVPPKPLPRSVSLPVHRNTHDGCGPAQRPFEDVDCRRSLQKSERPAGRAAHMPAYHRPTAERSSKVHPGSLLVFDRGLYEHWAVYVGNGQVVHLAGDEELKRRTNNARAFVRSLFGGTDYLGVHVDTLDNIKSTSSVSIGDEISEHCLGQPFPAQAVVERALLLVGQRGYHLKYNNCEHFAKWARYGRGFSDQSKKWFKPLPEGCTAAEVRARVDKRTHPHLATTRHAWLGVATEPAALRRFKFLGKSCARPGFRDVGLRVKKLAKDVFYEGGSERARSALGLLAASVRGWLSTLRDLPADAGKSSEYYCHKTKVFDESDIEATLSALVDFRERCASDGHAIRQIAASGGMIAVAVGRLLSGEIAEDLHIAKSVQDFAKSVEQGWRRSSPRYVCSCVYFNGYWVAAASNGVRLDDQTVFWSKDISAAREKISMLYEQGYLVSCVAAGPVWVVFMDRSIHTACCRQEIFLSSSFESFPAEHLRQLWREGLVLTAAAGN